MLVNCMSPPMPLLKRNVEVLITKGLFLFKVEPLIEKIN